MRSGHEVSVFQAFSLFICVFSMSSNFTIKMFVLIKSFASVLEFRSEISLYHSFASVHQYFWRSLLESSYQLLRLFQFISDNYCVTGLFYSDLFERADSGKACRGRHRPKLMQLSNINSLKSVNSKIKLPYPLWNVGMHAVDISVGRGRFPRSWTGYQRIAGLSVYFPAAWWWRNVCANNLPKVITTCPR